MAADPDYAPMAKVYDRIMTAGYYDYGAVAGHLAAVPDATRILELGVGTGLVIEQLLKYRSYDLITGVDLTPDMLARAAERLGPQADLREQNVADLDLGGQRYDLIWSYGGPWYLVPDGESYAMISHIRDDGAHAASLERAAAHLARGGRLLLGIQAQHRDYSADLGDGATYAQRIFPLRGGFRKMYMLIDNATGAQLMRPQVTDYSMYLPDEAFGLLAACGLRPGPPHGPMFAEFTRA